MLEQYEALKEERRKIIEEKQELQERMEKVEQLKRLHELYQEEYRRLERL